MPPAARARPGPAGDGRATAGGEAGGSRWGGPAARAPGPGPARPSAALQQRPEPGGDADEVLRLADPERPGVGQVALDELAQDRKSTRLNSSHLGIPYAVFCLKKKRD